MILLDPYPLLADEPAAEEVERLLRDGGATVTTVAAAEGIEVVALPDRTGRRPTS